MSAILPALLSALQSRYIGHNLSPVPVPASQSKNAFKYVGHSVGPSVCLTV